MLADFFRNNVASCLRCIFSGDSWTVDNLFRNRQRNVQGERGDIENRTVLREASPYPGMKRIYRRSIYNCIYMA